MKNGFDASHYQTINFTELATNKLDFAIFKATQGNSFLDPNFVANVKGARGIKIPLVGAYHFATFTDTASAESQANFCVSKVKGIADFVALDIEQGSGNLTSECLTFMEIVSKAGIPVEWYSYTSFIEGHLTANTMEKYPNWIADYQSVCNTGGVGSWDSWQYTQTGTLKGINGYVDRDYMTDARFTELYNEVHPPTYRIYTIVSGDTLWGIANKEGTTVTELEKLNGLTGSSILQIGEKIKIPN